MSDFRIDKITNRDGSAGTQIAGITTFSGSDGIRLPSGPAEYRGGRGRGVVGAGGVSPSTPTNSLNYITIATTGNAVDFGDMTITNHYSATSNASSTRATAGGGNYTSSTDVIDYVQIMTAGNAIDFGNLSASRAYLMKGCFSNGHGGL